MSLESYAVHIAPKGGKIDQIATSIDAERQTASDQRNAFATSKGAIGTYGRDSGVTGLLFPYEDDTQQRAKLPDGWRQEVRTEHGVVAMPKAKDRTKEARALTKQLKAELAALPKLPGAMEFSSRIGTSWVIVGLKMRQASFERIGDTLFVFTPWVSQQDETGNLDDDDKAKTAFQPEGCERVGLSVYYAAKEALVA